MIIGAEVEQRLIDEADPTDYVIKLRGTVVALERGGQPASWSALVMTDHDCRLVAVPAEFLTVVVIGGARTDAFDLDLANLPTT